MADFLRRFALNLIALIVMFFVLYLIFPGLMRLVFQVYFAFPLLLLLLVAYALPRRRR